MLALAATAFWVIFLAELGDKTLFMVLLLAARFPPWRVFLGASLAFVIHGAIAVALGQLLAGLPHAWVRLGAAALFLFFGAVLLLRPAAAHRQDAVAQRGQRPLLTAFTFIFLGEWGDMTQIVAAAMVADHAASLGRVNAALAVFTGSVVGLLLGAGLATMVGHRAAEWLPERLLRRVAGACFLGVGLFTALWQR